MSRPTADTETPRPSAISGSMPMTTNSVLPMPKAPMARARSARGTGELQRTTGEGGCGGLRRPAGKAFPRGSRVHAAPCPGGRVGLLTAAVPGDRPAARDRAGSGLEQHLDRAVLLLAEVR